MFKFSQYNLRARDYPHPGEQVLFNGLTRAMILVDEELLQVAEAHCQGRPPDGEARQQIKTLEEMGFLVRREVDETRLLAHYINRLKYRTGVLNAMVLTTYQCNLACTYCVEDGVKDNIYMDEETCQAVVDWLISRADEMRPHRLDVNFFGGEPLLNVPVIERVCRGLKAYAEEAGSHFQATLTTAGVLLTPELVERLRPLGLKGAKITIDGDRSHHDKKRPFKGGRGTYERIMENLEGIAGQIYINVGGNFDAENVESMSLLLDDLKRRGLADRIGVVDFKPILPKMGDESPPVEGELPLVSEGSPSACQSCHGLSQDEMGRHLIGLKREAMARGFNTTPSFDMGVCSMVMNDSAIIIDPLGKLYSCPPLVGREAFCIGDLFEEGFSRRHDEFVSLDAWDNPDCRSCCYAPICGGGCRYSALMNQGSIGAKDCRKALLDQICEEMIKIEYDKQLMADTAEEET